MSHHHGVEWYHDKLSLIVAAGGKEPRLYTGLNYSDGTRVGVRDGLPARATHALWAHWKCLFSGKHSAQYWLDDGVAIQPPYLEFASENPNRCALCGSQ